MRPYKTGAHTKYDLKVHLVWITKYRYTVLVGEVGNRIRDIIRQICDQNEIEIIKGRVAKNHIHLYVAYPPKMSISDIVQMLKGRSSRMIQQEFPALGKKYWGRHFWATGYGAFSTGLVDDATIQAYLDNHEERSDSDDDFVVE